MEIETVKGFKDFTGKEAVKREEIRKILIDSFKLYGFEPADTPVVEYRDFVKGDNTDDEAVSDVFKLEDKGNRKLALRYEFTFQLKRLMKNQKLPYKRYAIGPVFRDEPVSGNRLRQFVQCDVDTVGSKTIDEAEVLAVVKTVLEKLGIEYSIFINNRKLLNEILEKENIEKCDWEKVIREIDKLDKGDEDEIYNNLRGYNAQNLIELFKKSKEFFEKYESYSEIKKLQEYCDLLGVKTEFSPSLARGLSYYNGSVFEVKTKKIKETITAGGSFMFEGIQCTGLSFGLDRLSVLVDKTFKEKENYMILSINEDERAIKIIKSLREKGYNCMFSNAKISKALEYANSKEVDKILFIGPEEIKNKKYKIKDMKTGNEDFISETSILSSDGSRPDFQKNNGLLPVIVQDYKTNKVLMLAYMNQESWDETIQTKKACYFSRSRNKLWRKGEESGNVQNVKSIYLDCDNDTALIKVEQIGDAACHKGYNSCFFREVKDNKLNIIEEMVFNPEEKYGTKSKH